MNLQPPATIDRRLLVVAVAAAAALAWFDAVTLPRLALAPLALTSVVVWLLRRRRSTGQQSSPGHPLYPLLFVAALVVVSVFNPSHTTKLKIKTNSITTAQQAAGDARSITAKTEQTFTPRASHLPAFPGTVNPQRTTDRALALAAVIALGAAVYALARSPGSVRLALWLITLNGIAVALVAYHYKAAGSELLLGRFEPANPRFFGPFRYNNFWAAWNILVAAAASGLLLDALQRRRRLTAALAGLSLVPLTIAVVTSQSRSALLVSLLFATYLAAELTLPLLRRLGLVSRKPVNLKKALLITATAGLVLAAAAVVTVTSTWHRWATPEYAATQSGRMKDTIGQFIAMRQGHLPDLRPALSRDTVKMALAKPVWGWGLGSFEYAFPRFAGPEFLEDRYQQETNHYGKLIRAQYAHNDWAQYWAELGSVGFAALLLALYRFLRPGLSRKSLATTPLSRPLLAGTTTVALFALWDFPLNNFAVLGLTSITLALAAQPRKRDPRRHPSDQPPQPPHPSASRLPEDRLPSAMSTKLL